MDRPSRPASPFTRRSTRRSLAALAAAAAAFLLLVHSERTGNAASPLTLKTIAIDGSFGDWDAVLANGRQTTHDGDGSSSYLTVDNCSAYSTDLDCPQTGGSGNDFLTFAWTYDANDVYLYIERYGSTTNGVDLFFVADVNVDRRLTSVDRIVHAHWTPNTGVDIWTAGYVPANASAGDPIVCEPAAGQTFCQNGALAYVVPAGFVDGYRLQGHMGAETTCATCSARGGLSGTPAFGKKLELAIPWSAFNVASQQPFYWHVVSSNNGQGTFSTQSVDNIGAPGGGLGSFIQRGVSLYPDRSGAVLSPGTVTYAHTLANDGNDADIFTLSATDSQGAKVEVLLGAQVIATDSNGDGTWDAGSVPTVNLSPGQTQALSLRITMPAARSGQDVTRLTATSNGDSTVSATATDTSQVGAAAFVPASQAAYTVQGQAVPFLQTLVNGGATADTLGIVPSAGCSGFRVALAREVGGAPGAEVAVDANADGAWDPGTVDPSVDTDGDGLPDFGAIPGNGGSVRFFLLVTPSVSSGSSCNVVLSAHRGTTAAASSSNRVTVAPAVSFAPDHVGIASGSPDAQDVQVPVGGSVFFPATVRNAESSARVYDLSVSQTLSGASGTPAAPRIWSDPDGDGNPSDGAVIAQTAQLAAFGGAQHVVVEVGAGTVGSGGFLATTSTATATAGGAAASERSEAVVGYLAAYRDSLHTDVANVFAPCSTVYLGARGLLVSNSTSYALQWIVAPSTVQSQVSPWTTTADGTAEATYPLGAAAARGAWIARLLQGGTTLDDLDFQVEFAGTVAGLSTDRTRYRRGEAVTVSSSVRNGGGAGLADTVLTYTGNWSGATTRVRSAVDVAAGATVPDAYTFSLAADEAPGTYAVSLSWDLSCGASGLAPATASFQVAPPAPSLSAPTGAGANATPTISGTALPGASVTVTVTDPAGDRVSSGVVADATTGAFSWTVPSAQALSDGGHVATATQTAAGVTSDPSAPLSFSIDTVPPAAPAIDAPADLTLTNVAAVAVHGTAADPDAVSVRLVVDAVPATGLLAVDPTTRAFSATVTLADGAHVLRARALDAVGNVSADSAAVHVTVDLVPPLAPTDLYPADGALLGQAQAGTGIDATGTAEEGATVHLVLRDGVGNVLLDVPAATRTGTPPTSYRAALGVLADGGYQTTVTARDPAGNLSPAAVASFTVDTTVAPPVFTAPAPGATLNGSAGQAPGGVVTVSGTAEPGASVRVTAGAESTQTLAADASTGAWSTTFSLGDTGVHTTFDAGAAQTDRAGNASGSSLLSFSVDTRTLAPSVTSPVAGATLSAASAPGRVVPVSGTTESGATVRLVFEDVATGATTSADATVSGTSFSASVALPADGTYRLVATATDAAANPPTAAGAVQFVLDTVSDAPPVTSPTPGALLNLADTPNGVVVTGTAEAGATVTVTIGTAVQAAAAPSGSWSATFAGLADGPHTIVATAEDAAHNPPSAETRVSFSLDRTPPAAPLLSSPSAGPTNAASIAAAGTAEAGAIVRLQLRDGVTGSLLQQVDATRSGLAFDASFGSLAEGRYALTAIAIDAAGNPSPGTTVAFTVDRTVVPPAFTAPAAGATLNGTAAPGGVVTVSGSAEPGAAVTVAVGALPSQTLTADATTGAWTTTFSVGDTGLRTPLTATASQTDPAGNASGQASLAFDVDTRSLVPSITSPAAGATLNLADTPSGVVVSGTAETGATVTVAIGATQQAATATAGAWSATFAGLADGSYTVSASAADDAGNPASAQTQVQFLLDRTPPSAPSITSPSAGPTNATSVTVAGTADPGETVRILLDGVLVATATADANGAFSTSIDLPAATGITVALTAVVRDAAGNDSAPSASVAIEIDRTAPAAPTVDAPTIGAEFAPGPIEVRGHAEAGARVSITVAGTTVEATAGTDGAFAATISVPEGSQTISVVATDAAGNASAPTTVAVTARTTSGSGGGGCGCGQGSAAPSALAALALVALAPRRRRSR